MSRNTLLALALMGSVGTVPPVPAAPHLGLHVLLAPSSYLGVGIIEVGPETARKIGLVDPHGVEISSVAEESPAHKAGLLQGDIVLTYRDERVNGIEHFARLVRETPAGGRVELGVVRDRDRIAMDVEIGKRETASSERESLGAVRDRLAGDRDRLHALREHLDSVKKRLAGDKDRVGDVRDRLDSLRLRLQTDSWGWCEDCPEVLQDLDVEFDMAFPAVRVSLRSSRLGLELEEVDGQLAAFFGAEAGVLVRQVQDGSPGHRAGLRAGDVLVSLGGQRVRRPSDVARAVSSWQEAGEVPVEVVRDREPTSLLLDPRPEEKPVPARPVSSPN